MKEVIIGHCERGCNNTRFVESGIGVITWLARQLIQSFKTDGLTGEAYWKAPASRTENRVSWGTLVRELGAFSGSFLERCRFRCKSQEFHETRNKHQNLPHSQDKSQPRLNLTFVPWAMDLRPLYQISSFSERCQRFVGQTVKAKGFDTNQHNSWELASFRPSSQEHGTNSTVTPIDFVP